MNNNVLINIKSYSSADDENIELFTKGELLFSDNICILRYEETGDSVFSGNTTVLKVCGNSYVEISRSDDSEPMRVEREKRSLFRYTTPDGEFYFGIIADYIKNTLTEGGGLLSFKYLLDINNEPFNEIEMTVSVRRIENEQCN